ncbi:hypothetical protein BH20CHL6_BH20CHL6_20530 [soil metagenome]|jgi:hypothetical protein
MKRTQVYLTEEQDRRLTNIARERGIPKARALRCALDAGLETGDPEAESRAMLLATAGVLADYPDWPEWQRQVRGRTAAQRLDEVP